MAEKEKRKKAGRQNADSGKWSIHDYLIQVSVVIIGILVTFQGSAWIERNHRRNEVREILTMVNDELRENLGEVERGRSILKWELNGTGFFARHISDIRQAPADSLAMHASVLGITTDFFHSTNALEVLKTSSSSVNAMDKTLLREIFTCYDSVSSTIDALNSYYEKKSALIDDFYLSVDRNTFKLLNSDADNYPYIEKYLENTSTGNFIMNAGPNLSHMIVLSDNLVRTLNETMGSIEDYAGKKSRRRK